MPKELKKSFQEIVSFGYQTFSEYVTKERLVPSVEDGLKPVYKRVLLAAHELCPRNFVKTATLSGYTLGNYHPHSIDAIDDVITQLVHMGLLEGDGAFGSKSLTGNHSPASASRYTQVRLNQSYARVLDNLLPYIDRVTGEMDKSEAAYIPSPVPILCGCGSFSLAPALMVRLPAFTWKSMLEAYEANDPRLLKSTYDYKIDNPECLDEIWKTGTANMIISLDLRKHSLNGIRGVLISGSPELFVPDLTMLDAWKTDGLITITDISSGKNNQLFIGINKGVRTLSQDQIIDELRPFVSHRETITMMALDGETAYPCGLRAWIKKTLSTFCGLVDKYKTAHISACENRIAMYRVFDKVRDYMLKHASEDISEEKIAKALGVEPAHVHAIDQMSMRTVRTTDPETEIKKLESEIRRLSKIRGKAEARKLVEEMETHDN